MTDWWDVFNDARFGVGRAMEAIVRGFEARVRRQLLRQGIWNRWDQEDQLQEVFARLWAKPIDSGIPFEFVVVNIARDVARNFARKQQRRPRCCPFDDVMDAPDEMRKLFPDGLIAHVERYLPPDKAELFRHYAIRFCEGYRKCEIQADAAARFGWTIDQARGQIDRMLEQVKRILREHPFDEGGDA